MKTPTLILLCLLTTAFCHAQNLVPNPSFEDTIACPEGANNTDAASHWFSSRGSPDYLNSCATFTYPNVGTPYNWGGYQPPLEGNAYAALLTYGITTAMNVREIISTTLSEPLNIGTKYFVSAYISRGFSDITQCATNNFGFRFSTQAYHVGANPIGIDNFSHINTTSIITDTVNWIWVGGSFIADSNYQYLLIGNFYDDFQTDTFQCADIQSNASYYFIDLVCVTADSGKCELALGYRYFHINAINISPNPATTKLYCNNLRVKGTLCNLWGEEILPLDFTQSSEVDIANVPNGVYVISYVLDGRRYAVKQVVMH